MKDLVILGAGGHAREVLWLIRELNDDEPEWNVLGFIDEARVIDVPLLCDLPVLGDFGWFGGRRDHPLVVCGVGSNRTRRHLVEASRELGLRFATLIHPGVPRSRFVEVAEGSLVFAGTVLTTQVRIGAHVNVNTSCTIAHDTVIEDFCNVSPGVHISGAVHVEEGADIGTGAVILPGKRVGRGAVVGAGAVVTADVPPRSVAMGVPARVTRTLDEGPADGGSR